MRRVGQGGVGVGDEHQFVVHLHGVPGGGLAAAVGQGSGDDQGVDPPGLQDLVQPAGARHEGPEAGLVDEEIALADLHARPERPAMTAVAEGVLEAGRAAGSMEILEPVGPALHRGRIHGHLQEDVGPTAGADRPADGVDVGHDVLRDRNLHRRAGLDEAVLHVDDHMRRAGQVEGLEHVQRAAALAAGELRRLGRDADLVHDRLLAAAT